MKTRKSNSQLREISKLLRYHCLNMTAVAGSGHLTSSLSAVELMAVLYFDGFLKFDLEQPDLPENDRVIFSKGHASPLFYSLYAVAGKVTPKQLQTFRQFGSSLEGHPTPSFPYTTAATGSLGQGLSVGVGLALSAKYLDKTSSRAYVLLGDSEMAEGQIWEAMQVAAYYQLNNLIGILDMNRLGQRGETMIGRDANDYAYKARAFGWESLVVDGHDLAAIKRVYTQALEVKDKPVLIVARTNKGQGVSFLADKENWHGKALNQAQLQVALQELGDVNLSLKGKISPPHSAESKNKAGSKNKVESNELKQFLVKAEDKKLATRKAYGNALVKLGAANPRVVALDAEVSNSTYAQLFKAAFPERFFEMFVAEQNMVGVGVGLAKLGKIPFLSTFSAFWSRAFDQLRMAQYSDANLKIVGSHAGVSIGKDGSSQMGLEDLALMRSLRESVVLYPSDAFSTEKLVFEMAKHSGLVYLRTTRMDTPLIYKKDEEFEIGGSKVLHSSKKDVATVVAAGITLHEVLSAYRQLRKHKINIRVIDLYSLKPLDKKTLFQAAGETPLILTVEDHYPVGGIGAAVKTTLVNQSVRVKSLSVTKVPHSGQPAELLAAQKIDARAIVEKIKELIAE